MSKQSKQQKQQKPKKALAQKPVKIQQKAPVSVSTFRRMGRPKFTAAGEDVVVTHCEMIADLSAPATNPGVFQVPYIIRINPGLSGVFPWLSGLAGRFESYVFEELEFTFDPAVATSTDGAIYMAVDYDSADTAPANKVQLMAIEHSTKSDIWTPVTYRAPKECLHKRKTYYTRGLTTLPDVGELNLSDVGVLYIGTAGLATASKVLGELYVRYRVRLMTPSIEQQSSSALLQVSVPSAVETWSNLLNSCKEGVLSSYKTKSPLWDDLVNVVNGTSNMTKFNFKKPGNYFLQLDVAGDTDGTTINSSKAIISTMGSGCTATTQFANPYTGRVSSNADSGWFVKVTDPKDAFIEVLYSTVAGSSSLVAGLMTCAIDYASNLISGYFSLCPDRSSLKSVDGREFIDHQRWVDAVVEKQLKRSQEGQQQQSIPYFQGPPRNQDYFK